MNPDPKLLDELKEAEGEPLLPVEKTLIRWSLAVGLTLTVLLAWLSRALGS